MKTNSTIQRFTLAVAAWLGLVATVRVQAQYTIDWFAIASGGGTSTGGVYTATVHVGQPEAGTMSGDNRALHGGFWGVVAAVQTPGAPRLTVARMETNTVVIFVARPGGRLVAPGHHEPREQWQRVGGDSAALPNQRVDEYLVHQRGANWQHLLSFAQTVNSRHSSIS